MESAGTDAAVLTDALITGPLLLLGTLCGCVIISEWLCRHTPCRHLGTALIVIVVTAILANFNIVPTSNSVVYDGVFSTVAPLCIFWLLLQVNLRRVMRAGSTMVGIFLLGSAGTTLGVMVAMRLVDGAAVFAESYAGLGGMFVGTYTGGSINFNALALHYKIAEEGIIYSGAMAVDSILTTIWMIATIAIPLALPKWRRPSPPDHARTPDEANETHGEVDAATITPMQLSVVLGMGLVAVRVSNDLAAHFSMPSILFLTTIALICAQVPAITNLRAARTLGMFSVYLFLAVIGAYCDVSAVAQLGTIGPRLLIFATVVIAVHGVVIFGGGLVVIRDIDLIAVASQANIGGGTTALALARTLRRNELVLPAVLVGALGNAVGTYLGLATAKYFI
jgi:uncharacterized membrane protein